MDDTHVAIEANANHIIDEADRAYAEFVAAAREFAAKGIEAELADEQPGDLRCSPGSVCEVDLLDLAKEKHRHHDLGDRLHL